MLARGLAGGDLAELQEVVLQAWDDFIALAEGADLSQHSRLPGWTGSDLVAHIGTWPDADQLSGILDSARNGTATGLTTKTVDDANAAVVRAHGGESREAVLKSLHASRDAVADVFASPEWADLATRPASSPLGAMALATVLHAGVYELVVHALDLEPCGAPSPSPLLLDRGVAALIDVVGALAFSQSVETRVTAVTPEGGWTCVVTADGWTTERFTGSRPTGAGIRGDADTLLDASAGRNNPVTLVLRRKLVPSDLKAFIALAPLLDAAPGLPGGRALKAAAGGLSKVTRRFRK